MPILRAIMIASAKSSATSGAPPVLGMTHMISLTTTIVLIIYFLARVALWRRKAKRLAVVAA